MYRLAILFLFLFCFSNLHSQDTLSTKNQLSLSLGYNQGYFKDINFSPLNYNISGGQLVLAYQRNLKNRFWDVSLEANYNLLPTKAADFFTANHFYADLSASYLWRIKKAAKMDYYIGPKIESNNHFVTFAGLNSFTFLFVHSIGADFRLRYKLSEKASLSGNVSLPILHLLARPPYNGFDKQTEQNAENPLILITAGNFTSVNSYLASDLGLSYSRRLSRRFMWSLDYNLQVLKTFEIQPIFILRNQYASSIQYNF